MNTKTEVTFMVYRQNGSGKIEKRILELENQDYIACTSSNRDKNEKLMAWAHSFFPNAKSVKIQGVKKIVEKKEKPSKKSKKKSKSVFKGNILFLPFRIIYRVMGWIFRNA